MSPTNPAYGQPLSGDQAFDASQPLADQPRGGVESSTPGISGGQAPMAPGGQFAGLGPFLEQDDQTVFKAVHNLVLRQERLAKNRLAIDTHWTRVKLGYPFSRLEKVQDQDVWRAVLPPGTTKLETAAVPNKAADLCAKVVETLMVDPPQPAPEAENDSEEAERAAEMAEEFLTQDGGEKGTRDAFLFWNSLDAACTRASAYHAYWVDPSAGGYVPLQIQAHPQAVDPQNALVGPDGMPTTDPILRYVTAQGQFTEDPSQAAPQWVPKIRIDRLGREHVRCYPETASVADAEKVILLWYCTLGEAKRRWPDTVGQMDDDELGVLADWVPPRYLVLLPPALRARWKLATGDATDPKGSSNDERIVFFYCVHVRPSPDYKQGATVYVSGANAGTILGKDTLSASIPHPKGTDLRCMDLPIVQVEMLSDPDEKDPTGIPLMARFGGASEATARLIQSYLEAIDIILHPARYTTVTSPVSGDDVENSRATGDHIPVLSAQDYPQYEQPRPLPPNFLDMVVWQHEQMNSASGVTKPAMGADDQQEVSGVARNIAVRQALVSLSRMQQALWAAYERHWRIKIQLAMKYFSVPQQIRYAGEDGAYKQEWWRGVDFAGVTDIGVQPGTGTMMSPQEKVNYLASLKQMQFMDPDSAADAARPTFATTLGLPEDTAKQRIERQVSAWLKGPPSPQWVQQWQMYSQQMQQYQAVQQQQQQAAQAQAQAQATADAHLHPQPAPQAPQVQMPVPQAPWHPFANVLPCDDEPLTATTRQRRLKKLMETARYEAQPPEWQQVVVQEYQRMRQAVAASQPVQIPRGVTIGMTADASTVRQEEQAASGQAPQQSPTQPMAA